MKGSDHMYYKLVTDTESYQVGKNGIAKIELKQIYNTCMFKVTEKDGRSKDIPINRAIYAEEGQSDHLKLVKEKK